MQLSRFMVNTFAKKKLVINTSLYCSVLNNGIKNYKNINNLPFVTEKIEHKYSNALDVVPEDVSTIVPYFPRSFNLAAYVNNSESLKKLVQLDINLSQIEKKPYIAERILKLDFEESIQKHIFFLKDYIDPDAIGSFITKNPMILCEPLEDLEVRMNYLQSKKFSIDQIRRIISQNPFWLMFSTKRIDKRLGFYQKKFSLTGEEVRQLTTKQAKIITYNLHHINTNTFVIKEEMGFEDNEVKQLIMKKPKLWMISKLFLDKTFYFMYKVTLKAFNKFCGKGQKALLERFNYLHNVVKIPHFMLLKFPEVLLCRNYKVKQRHLFLQKLGRAQYDPKKENFIPILSLVEGTDVEFCKNFAKCNVDDFNIFLKTM